METDQIGALKYQPPETPVGSKSEMQDKMKHIVQGYFLIQGCNWRMYPFDVDDAVLGAQVIKK